jgi:all-trans-retinol 13,14-reductase
VERWRKVGPLLRRFRRGGVWCDAGFHYTGGFRPGGALDVLLRYLGARDGLEPVALNADGFDVLYSPEGREVRIPAGLENLREALSEAYPASAGAAGAYTAEIGRTLAATPFLRFDFAPDEVVRMRKGDPRSLADFLAGAGAEADLTLTLGAYGQMLYGSPGDEVPIDFHAIINGSLYESACMLRRGGDAIVAALEGGLRCEGVEILCGRRVEKILTEGRAVRGVELEGGDLLEAEACIATVHPRLLAGMLEPAAAPALLARVARQENSIGLFGVFLEVDEAPERLRGRNSYQVYGRDQVLAVLACGAPEPGDRPSTLALMPSRWRAEEPYAEYKARETARVLGEVLALVPELRGRCRVVETVSPRAYEAFTGAVGGAPYGIRQSVRQRPLSFLTGVGGLTLAGQSVLMPGVMGAMISGLIAAAQVVGIDVLWREVQRWR